ncbi:MAG: zinc ribbon domain-containing protein [Pontiellaceae bacterium]|nr:zinc ribbon domain-containing protein [Pontiellaceae bacterium]
MPIYEYQCSDCSTAFEQLVSGADRTVMCIKCGSERIEKQFSTFSATTAAQRPAPCSGGSCPSAGMAGTGCSGGCPHA